MSKSDSNYSLVVALSIFVLSITEIVVFFFLFLFLITKVGGRYKKLFILFSISLIVISFFFPTYYLTAIDDISKAWGRIGNAMLELDIKGSIPLYLLSFINFSYLSHIFFVHISFTLAFTFSAIFDNELHVPALKKGKRTDKKLKEGEKRIVNVEQKLDGETIIGFRDRRRIVSTKDNARHIFCAGTTGSGKTVLLANYIESASVHDYPLLVIDGKGDIGEDSLLDICNKLKGTKQLYAINLADPASSAHYNPFKGVSPSVGKDMLMQLSDWSEEHYKANTDRYVQRILTLMSLLEIPFTLESILYHLPDAQAKRLCGKAFEEKKINKEYHEATKAIIKTSSAIANDAVARFASIFESDAGSIFSEDGRSIFEMIEEKAIVLFVLNPLRYPVISAVLGRLALIDASETVSNLYTADINRTFFVFDEISVYASHTLLDILNKSRSARVTCICATQSLSDLDDAYGEAFRERVIENVNNYIVMRQNSAINSEAWASVLGTEEALNITYQLGNEDFSDMSTTGRGSARKERRFLYHPDDIKRLMTGEAVFMSKDTNEHYRIMVRKGF